MCSRVERRDGIRRDERGDRERERQKVCQLVEVIREADANETSWEDGLVLPGSLVGESQLRIPKLEPDIMFSNRVLSYLSSLSITPIAVY